MNKRQTTKISVTGFIALSLLALSSLKASAQSEHYRPLPTARFVVVVDSIVQNHHYPSQVTYKQIWDNGTEEIRQVNCSGWISRTVAYRSSESMAMSRYDSYDGWVFIPNLFYSESAATEIPAGSNPANASAIFVCDQVES